MIGKDFKGIPILRIQFYPNNQQLHVFFKQKEDKIQERVYIGESKKDKQTTMFAFYGMFHKKPAMAMSYYSENIKEQYQVLRVNENVKFVK